MCAWLFFSCHWCCCYYYWNYNVDTASRLINVNIAHLSIDLYLSVYLSIYLMYPKHTIVPSLHLNAKQASRRRQRHHSACYVIDITFTIFRANKTQNVRARTHKLTWKMIDTKRSDSDSDSESMWVRKNQQQQQQINFKHNEFPRGILIVVSRVDSIILPYFVVCVFFSSSRSSLLSFNFSSSVFFFLYNFAENCNALGLCACTEYT